MRKRVVIDTNTWISALLNPGVAREIVCGFEKDIFTLVCSDEILAELVRVLDRPHIASKISKERAQHLVSLVHKRAVFYQLHNIPAISRDSADDVFLACAMVSKSYYLVTGDNDLLCLCEYQGTKIITLAEFSRSLKSQN